MPPKIIEHLKRYLLFTIGSPGKPSLPRDIDLDDSITTLGIRSQINLSIEPTFASNV